MLIRECVTQALPKSNKTSSYIEDHSKDIVLQETHVCLNPSYIEDHFKDIVLQETHVCLNHAQEHKHLLIVSIKEGK